MPTDAPLITAAGAAKHLGVTPRALYRLVDCGELPAFKVGRQLQFRWDDLEAMRTTAAARAESLRDRESEKRRALDLVGQATEDQAHSLKRRDRAILWVAREHGASLREIADATGLPHMTIKRIIDRASEEPPSSLGS